MQNKQHKIAIAALTATLGLGNFVLSKIKSDWNPEKGGVVKALAEFDNPKPLDSLTMPISDFIEEGQKTKPVDLNQKITLEDIRIGKVILNYDPEKQMYFSETVKEIQILLSQATGIQLQIDGIVGPLTTNGIGTNSIGAARWYACSRGLKDRSGAITAELLLALETNMPALPLLAIGEASLADIANERLSLSGTPIIISHKEHGQFFSKAYQEAQFFMQEAGIDLGHYGADGYFGQDGVTRLLPTYLRSRGINAASYELTPLIAKALIDQKPPLSVQEEIRNIISKKWFKELNLNWQKTIIKFALSLDDREKLIFFQILNSSTLNDLNTSHIKQALNIVIQCGKSNLAILAHLFSLPGSENKPSILTRPSFDLDRTPLVSWLHEISCGELDPRISQDLRPQLIRNLILDIVFPYTYTQDKHNTCGTIQALKYFFHRYPGEAFRLATGLLKKEGRVAMCNGDSLIRDEDVFSSDSSFNRTLVERIFEASLMEYINGEADYQNSIDRHVNLSTGKRSVGVSPTFAKRALEALCGEPFTICKLNKGYSSKHLFEIAANAPFLTLVCMEWRSATADERIEFGLDKMYHALGCGGKIEGAEGLVFYNPWGTAEYENGEDLSSSTSPKRVVHRKEYGSELWTKEEALKRLTWVVISANALNNLDL